MEKAEQDSYCRQYLAEVAAREPLFLNIRSSLPQMQQKALDAYISACETLDHARLPLAENE